MTVATTDAYRNIVVTGGLGVVPGTTVANTVGSSLSLVAGLGINLVTDAANNKITIINTGNGTGAYTTVTDNNANDTFYPIFTKAPTAEYYNPLSNTYQMDTMYLDQTASPMTYNPSTGVLTAVGFTGALTGNASTATKLAATKNINGVAFDGSADITVTAAAGTLTGNTLASGVTASSLTSVGTLLNLTVTNTISGSISGNAGTVTNGVVTTGSYSDPSWLTISKSKVGLGNVENTALSTSTHYIGTTSITYNRASASQTLTGVSIDGNAGTVTNGVYTSSSFNLGTTSITWNRASASQSLTGISIDGNAGTVTNGVYTTGSYSDPSWLTISKSKVGLGSVENTALSTSTYYIGTTQNTYGRASASQTLTGVSIDGNAGTVTNGVYTSSSFNLGTTSITWNRASASQSLTGISIDGSSGSVANAITISTGLTLDSGTTYNGSAARTLTIDSTVTTLTGTQTLTNKRVTQRSVTDAGTSGTLTPTGNTADVYTMSGLTGALTVAAPSGTPTDGQRLMLRIKDNGTARGITWTTSAGGYRAIGFTLPSTTVISKWLYIGCIYNSVDGYWDVLSYSQQ